MKKNRGFLVTFYTVAVAVFFLAGFFLLVVFGAQSYRRAARGQEQNNQNRALLSYLSTCVEAGDREGAVRVVPGDGDGASPMLVVEDGEGGYALRIYMEGGRLLEEYSPLDQAPDPSSAQEIGRTEVFRVEELTEGTFAVTTDAGRTLFSVRSGRSGAEVATDEQ